MAGEFWEQDDDFSQMFVDSPNSSVVSSFINGEVEHKTTMFDLTDKGREAKALPLDSVSGTRVSFVSNIGSVMSYAVPPSSGLKGTVVTVRTSSGDTTRIGENIFVKWDDGQLMPIHQEHLRVVSGEVDTKYKYGYVKSQSRIVVSNFGVLAEEFSSVDGSNSDLIHKATKDLWSFRKDEKGGYVLERLFDQTGEVLKSF